LLMWRVLSTEERQKYRDRAAAMFGAEGAEEGEGRC
jgi:hypothetical protein